MLPDPVTSRGLGASDPEGSRGRCFVLGGGGVAGIAWMTGLFLGLEEGGVDLAWADTVIGTSAGAAVAAQITSGVAMSDLFDRQVVAERQVRELSPRSGI